MFTGLVQEVGFIERTEIIESGAELVIRTSPIFFSEAQHNVAINGTALTIQVKEDCVESGFLKFYVSDPAKITNNFPRQRVNLERAICLGEEIAGNLFYGIPSGQVKLISREMSIDGKLFIKVSFMNRLVRYLSAKDQVCLDGVLLRIKNIDEQELLGFEIYPTTLGLTNLGDNRVGDMLNMEIDPLVVKVGQIFDKFNLI